ncbi:MAG: sulfotransferase [Bacteroidales bacterium]|nr:sulfotransferase [Bacteroidales bacterium]
MLVDFMIIGAMKSGTSSLRQILMKHPDIEFSSKGESYYFSHTKNWKQNLASYHGLFAKKKNKIYGEGSTTYTQYSHFNLEIWKDIYEYNKNMKFIYIVRNPVDRVISHYIHLFQRGKINCTIEEAIEGYPEIINTSRYYTQIKPFIELFSKQNILIIDFDEFVSEKEEVVKKIAGFLNISFEKFTKLAEEHANKSASEYKINHKYDSIIRKIYSF